MARVCDDIGESGHTVSVAIRRVNGKGIQKFYKTHIQSRTVATSYFLMPSIV